MPPPTGGNGPADTPGSVGTCVPDGHLSRGYVAASLVRSTRHLGEQPHRCLSDLAPGEVYPASPITRAPGGLLHHRFTLTPAPEGAVAVCSLLHFLADCSGWVLPTALLCGARTFLGAVPENYDATVWPTRSAFRIAARTQRPDSAVRTRTAFESGQRSTSSCAAARMVLRSVALSATPLALDTPPRR